MRPKQIPLMIALLAPCLLFGQAQAPSIDHRHDLLNAVNASETGPLRTGFRQNNGQLLNSNHEIDTTIAYYSESGFPQLFLSKVGILSWAGRIQGSAPSVYTPKQLPNLTESTNPDTLMRLDLIPVSGFNKQPVNSHAYAFEPAPDLAHYYLPHCGDDGIEKVPAYKKILFPDIYPGIHQQVNLYPNSHQIHYILSPGANIDDIRLLWKGFDRLSVSTEKLTAGLKNLELTLTSMSAYELDEWGRKIPLEWKAKWVKQSDGTFGLLAEEYNRYNTLVIPMGSSRSSNSGQDVGGNLTYSSYLGGNGEDHLVELMSGKDDRFYAAGYTSSHAFPATNGNTIPFAGGFDAFAMKFSSNLKLSATTYYGSTRFDEVRAATLNENGDLYIGGTTDGFNLFNALNTNPGIIAGFVVHLDQDLLFQEAIYHGGDNNTVLTDIDVFNDRVTITGHIATRDSVYPLMFGQPQGWFQSAMGGQDDGFIAQFTPELKMKYSSLFGGTGSDRFYRMDHDAYGNLYLLMTSNTQDYYHGCSRQTLPGELPLCARSNQSVQSAPHGGDDYYVVVFSPIMEVLYSTWLGGVQNEYYSFGADIVAVPGKKGHFYVSLATEYPRLFDLPSHSGGYQWAPRTDQVEQLLIIRFEDFQPTWSTFAGCEDKQSSHGLLELDKFGNLYLSGNTKCDVPQVKLDWCKTPSGNEFPICDNQHGGGTMFVQTDPSGQAENRGDVDAFMMGFTPNNELFWSTWYGGSGSEEVTTLHYDSKNNELFLGGKTNSPSQSIPLKKPVTGNSHYQSAMYGTMGGMMSSYTPVITTHVENMNTAAAVVRAWPNPAQTWLHLEMAAESTPYQVFTPDGRLVKEGSIGAYSQALEVSDLPTGQYILHLTGNENQGRVTFIRQ